MDLFHKWLLVDSTFEPHYRLVWVNILWKILHYFVILTKKKKRRINTIYSTIINTRHLKWTWCLYSLDDSVKKAHFLLLKTGQCIWLWGIISNAWLWLVELFLPHCPFHIQRKCYSPVGISDWQHKSTSRGIHVNVFYWLLHISEIPLLYYTVMLRCYSNSILFGALH